MFDRPNLIYGISFVGVGIFVLILTIWIEPLVKDLSAFQWMILGLRIVGVICIVAGMGGIIISFIPKK